MEVSLNFEQQKMCHRPREIKHAICEIILDLKQSYDERFDSLYYLDLSSDVSCSVRPIKRGVGVGVPPSKGYLDI